MGLEEYEEPSDLEPALAWAASNSFANSLLSVEDEDADRLRGGPLDGCTNDRIDLEAFNCISLLEYR